MYQDAKLVVVTKNAATSYTITGLVPPTRHAYAISAYDAAGNISAKSAPAVAAIAASAYDQTVLADQFPNHSNDGYVDFMGKCDTYSPSCEWESRMYDATNPQGRDSRISAYVFNPTAGFGSAADWQPDAGTIQAGQWVQVVGEYTTQAQPSGCSNSGAYPGSINIWVNGVKWDQAEHDPTGCMSQYDVKPDANNSPLNIGTMALDTWFKGAIGKVAIYSYLLTPAQIDNHYQVMTGRDPAGSCGTVCAL